MKTGRIKLGNAMREEEGGIACARGNTAETIRRSAIPFPQLAEGRREK